jgi:flagellar M-ring protein FliF
VLSSPQEDSVAGLSNSQLEVKKRLEDYLAGKAEDLLTAALGPGRAVVRVNAELDFRDIEVTKTTYDPNSVVRSEQTGAESNTQEGSKNETATTNYDINQTVERIVGGGGGITSLSVSVFVDKRPAGGENGAAGEFTPLAAEEIKQLEDIVKGAVGFDARRADVITVVNMPLASVESEGVETKVPVTNWLPGLITKVAAAAILVFLFLVFRKQIQKVFSEERAYPSFAAAIPAQRRKGGDLGAMEASLEERTRELSMNDPDQVVKLVKTWLAE